MSPIVTPMHPDEHVTEANRLLDDVDTETTSIDTDVELIKAHALLAIAGHLAQIRQDLSS